jgi:uncharacterized protein YcfL
MVRNRWLLVVVLILVGLQLAACGQETAEAEHEQPAMVETVEGTDVSRVTLSASAAERLGIETAAVEEVAAAGEQRMAVPYGAIFYDANGETWTYTNPESLVFIREHVMVDRIEGDQALLTEGPPSGTMVVTVGAAELWGTETGVGGSAH